MLAWILVILIVVAGLVYLTYKSDMEEFAVIPLIFLIFLLVPIVSGIETRQNLNTFENQKAYIEVYEPSDPIENAALTTKRVELNEWLFKAKWARENFGVFSVYPKSVLDIEPIN